MKASYVPVVQAEVLAGVWEAEVRRAAARVYNGQGHGQQASPQQVALFVQGRELPHHHGLSSLGEITNRSVDFSRDLPFQFIPAVLKPYFHLGLRELKWTGEAGALCAAQIAFHVEGRLQLENLSLGKNSARLLFRYHFALLGGAASFVRVCGGCGGAAVVAAAVPALEAHLCRLLRVSAADDDRLRCSAAVCDQFCGENDTKLSSLCLSFNCAAILTWNGKIRW